MRPIKLFSAVILASAFGAFAIAQDLKPPPAEPAAAATTPEGPAQSRLTREDLEAWLDGLVGYGLPREDIAGGVIVVVKDGQVLFKKGYGYSDVEKHTPVDADTTLFRPGSVSKLFTWTAVMQLVEQGKLDLDTDVNKYIDFKIPERDGKPVTLRNIMTHTAGFEEQPKGIMGIEKDGVPALDAHLKRWTPTRIFAPGTTPAYSNYATALAGYVVARVSGMTFDDYIDRNLFEPLEMRYASFRQPLPANLKPYMSKGYSQASEPEKPYEIVGPAPAGSLAASGENMGHFMIAHLQDGRYGDKQILKPETAQQMHTTALTILPRVNRMMLGFYESNYNGHRVISHGGDTQWFHSDLHLFLDDGVGIFMSFNSLGKDGGVSGLRTQVFEQFTDRYLPGPSPDGKVDEATAREHARMIAGGYSNSRRIESSFLSLLNLFSTIKVIANEDNTITVSMVNNLAGVPGKWREIAPFVWRQVDGKSLLSAKVEDGKVTRFSFGEVSPFMMFEPAPFSKSTGWLMPTLVAGLVAMLLTALAWPVSALTRRHYRVAYPLSGVDAKAHRWVRIVSLATVLLFAAWGITVVTMFSDLSLLQPKNDWVIWILQILSLVMFIGGAIVAVWNAKVVLGSRRSWYAKAWAIVLALSFLIALWVALAFHLIAFDVNY
jgi:CubicO group peptidase (beta-lactamase class C family)